LLALIVTAIPAPFTTDDCNYVSSVAGLRHGTLFVPGTAGLPPSRMLYAFDPMAHALENPETPVPPLVPPLYAIIAYPFSNLGWRGLVLLNVLATLGTFVLVFVAARRLANQERAGWYAALIWLLGASTLEYAQGLWPHMLAVSLTTAGMMLTALAILHRRLVHAALAGLLLALAAGMRYQNAVLVGSGLLVLLLWSRPRVRACAAFILGTLPPLVTSSVINHVRIHSWNPVSKGAHYVSIGAGQASSPVHEFFLSLWVRVVDYSAQPAFRDAYLRKTVRGDIVTWSVLKKSWLQGSPWVLVGFLILLLAWSKRGFVEAFARSHLRMMAIPLVSVLAVFGLAGVYRHDGVCFNQRYLLELAPLMAIAVGVCFSRLGLPWSSLVTGTVLGGGVAAIILLELSGTIGYRVQSIVPLLFAGTAAGLWLLSLARPRWCAPAGLATAACLAWSLVVHLTTDLQASRFAREINATRLNGVEDAIPRASPTAILAAAGAHDLFCPLLLDRDVVVLAKRNLLEAELPSVLDALLAQRRVFVWLERLSSETVSQLQSSYQMTMIRLPWLAEITHQEVGH
jgi:4-amino-4-deoxy-L-arabinose transferase-like glycosyltransferase